MQVADLRNEIRSHQTQVQKMRLQITMNTEKDTARYRREKRHLARMMTILTEKEASEKRESKEAKETSLALRKNPTEATVSLSKKPKKASKTSS